MKPPIWSILIPTVPSRAASLRTLLDGLLPQTPWSGLVRVTCWLNEGAPRLGVIRDRLVEHAALAGAEYVSFIDDDDTVSADYVSSILAALESRPDHVGFPIEYLKNGVPQVPVEHSLRHKKWRTIITPNGPTRYRLVRDFTHIDPIRIDLARRGRFADARPGQMEDRAWCKGVRPWITGGSEVYIDRPLYRYDWRPEQSAWLASYDGHGAAARRPDIQHPNLEWHPESL